MAGKQLTLNIHLATRASAPSALSAQVSHTSLGQGGTTDLCQDTPTSGAQAYFPTSAQKSTESPSVTPIINCVSTERNSSRQVFSPFVISFPSSWLYEEAGIAEAGVSLKIPSLVEIYV